MKKQKTSKSDFSLRNRGFISFTLKYLISRFFTLSHRLFGYISPFFVCCPCFYLTPQRYYAYYNSEQSSDGQEPIAVTDEKELPQECIEVFTDRAAASGAYNSVERADVIKSKNDSYTLHANPTFHLNIANFMNIETSSNRSGIGMLVSDGELQPVWNGQKYLSVALTMEELRKTISVKTPYQSGEKHDICMLYAELEDDQNFDDEPYSYSEMAYCTVEE